MTDHQRFFESFLKSLLADDDCPLEAAVDTYTKQENLISFGEMINSARAAADVVGYEDLAHTIGHTLLDGAPPEELNKTSITLAALSGFLISKIVDTGIKF